MRQAWTVTQEAADFTEFAPREHGRHTHVTRMVSDDVAISDGYGVGKAEHRVASGRCALGKRDFKPRTVAHRTDHSFKAELHACVCRILDSEILMVKAAEDRS
jgi:hypothetical protein